MRLATFEAIVRVLNDADVQFIVVGGIAVAAHGYLRHTRDVDQRDLGSNNPVRIVSLSTLIALKREAGRPQDLADVDQLKYRKT